MAKITVENTEITILKIHDGDFISLTDIARSKDSERCDYLIQNWMRNRSTLEFLALWEKFNNEDFKPIEFDGFISECGSNSFSMTPKRWIGTTNAKGIISRNGRNGGTYAHCDIAFEFATWISSEFKFYLIREFQRLKADEQKQLGWSAKRELAKVNYHIHTTAISQNLENINSVLINDGLPQSERLEKLNQIAIQQMKILQIKC